MNRISWHALAALAAAVWVVGCSSDAAEDGNGEDTQAIETGQSISPGSDSATASADMTLASNVYQKDGVAYCPVMGNPIPDVSLAAGVREHEDTTYYFC